jgi:hypothetical protein
MFFRALSTLLVLFSASLGLAQVINETHESPQPGCASGNCSNANQLASAPSLSSRAGSGKWEVQDFKSSDDAFIYCAVMKYDSTVSRPTLHLLCPGPDVFAPLRVHLALTWRNGNEIPLVMRSMQVERSSSVRFKSKPGASRAELTLQDPLAARSTKQWITFTEVNVGLVPVK